MTANPLYRKKSVTAVIAVTKKEKGFDFMRNKTQGINVRVTPKEKEKLLQNANYCGLSLSEYLRRLGLGKDVKAATSEKNYRIFRMLSELKSNADRLEKHEIIHRIETIQNAISK